MDDIKRALLGDHAAAKRLTDAGVLLPCPICGKAGRFEVVVDAEIPSLMERLGIEAKEAQP